jgi:environmental stress-induced protein Ves
VARIAQDGPFSAFPGVQRWFVVLSGAGVALQFGERPVHVTLSSPPLQFDGAAAPGCTLLDGATLDLNLMLRQDAGQGGLCAAVKGQPWVSTAPHRALFCTGPGQLLVDDEAAVHAPAMSLMHSNDARGQTWRWVADDAGNARAWWLHFEPDDTAAHRATLSATRSP